MCLHYLYMYLWSWNLVLNSLENSYYHIQNEPNWKNELDFLLQLHNIHTEAALNTNAGYNSQTVFTLTKILFYGRNHYTFKTLPIYTTTATPASLSPEIRIIRNQHWLDLEQWEVICQCTLEVFSSFLLLLLVNLWRRSCLCRSKGLQNSLF